MAYVLFRWEKYEHGYTFLGIYLGAPVLLIAVSVCMLKLVLPGWRLKLSLLAGSIIFATLLIESYLAFYGNIDLRVIKARASGIQFDQRSKKQMINDLRAEGRRAYPTIHPRLSLKELEANELHSIHSVDNQETIPLGGIASVTTVYNRESGQWVVYESDEYGFRNPAGTWKHDRFDLGVVGDSMAHGAGLFDGKDFVSLLRSCYPRTVNLASGANGPLTAFAAVHEYCTILKPRFVVYFYYEGNDLSNLSEEKNVPLLMRYLEEESWSQDLYAKKDAINSVLLNFVEKEIRKSDSRQARKLFQIFSLHHLRQRIGLSSGRQPELQPDLALFETVMQRMREEPKAWEGTFVLAYLPAWERYKNPDTYHVYRREVLEILRKNGIPVVDLHPVFQKQADVFSLFHFGLEGHYNQVGAQLVADEVRKVLESLYQ